MKRFVALLFLVSFFVTGFAQTDTLSLNSILSGDFYPNYVWGLESMNDGVHYTAVSFQNGEYLVKYSYRTGKAVDTLLNMSKLGIGFVSPDYTFSSDEKKILIYTNAKHIYRRSFTANFYVYDFAQKKLTPVLDSTQRIVTFSPDGNKVAFMRDNNLFIKDLNTGKIKQITFDGLRNHIINGAPDWVYEEEFSFRRAYQWSPDGNYLAYMKFDESKVKTYTLKFYPKDFRKPYPRIYTYKYPKAGEANSKVTVHIYNLSTGKTLQVQIDQPYEYVPRIKWRPDGKYLAIEIMNRHQDTLQLLYANPQTGKSFVSLMETNKYYIEDGFYDNLRFLPDNHILVMSERDGWRHFYLYDWDGHFIKQLTKGNWDVTDFIDYDPHHKILYYRAAKKSPIDREVYALNIKTGKDKLFAGKDGTNNVEFSKTYKYYLLSYSSATTPPYFAIYNSKKHLVREIIDNKALLDKVNKYGGIHKTSFTFTTGDGVKLWAYRIVPPDFDSTKQYPAIVMQYSGPNFQTVLNSWSFGWANYLAAQGFVIFGVDTRGTGARGEQFRKITYLQLGKYESQDLAEAGKYFASLPYINGKRLGLWGWSYGGFMVLSVLTRHPGIYNTGIAVAPVTSWRYYDDIYTERYMRTPQENPQGYDQNSPITYAADLQGHLLIIHGLADDNVHPENTFQFVTHLVMAGKQFKMQIYPNKNHALPGTYKHLYRMKTNFFKRYLMN